MKRMIIVMAALGLAVLLFSIANAGYGKGTGRDCGRCNCSETSASEPLRKFQADTIDLRQEMVVKRFEIQRENLKADPDKARIASLQADIKAIQSKVHDLRKQGGLPVDGCDGDCDRWMGGCDKKQMGGCNDRPCNGRK